MPEEMSKEKIIIKYPGTNSLNPEPRKEVIKTYDDAAKENQKVLNEINQQKAELDLLVPPEIQEKIARNIKIILALGIGPPALSLLSAITGCKPAIIQEQPTQEQQINVEDEVVIDSPETKPVEEEVVEKVDAPEIKGLTFNFIFDQEKRKYIDEETKEEVGFWIENAVMINGKMGPGIAFKKEALNKILEENRQKGIFKCPWPFNWQENKGMEIVELFWNPSYEQETFEKHGVYVPGYIGIKYPGPVNFYAPFDTNDEAPKVVGENIPDKKEDQNFFSAQKYKNLVLFSAFSYESEDIEGKRYGSIQFAFIDWKPLVALGKSYNLGNDAYAQDIIGEIKAGSLLGELLPRASDFEFLDFTNSPEFYENPGQFQGGLAVFDFQGDFSQPTSSLEKMLSYTDKAGQEIPVCVWPEENTAHEQTK